MVDEHPVLMQRGFTIMTPPLREFLDEFTRLAQMGELSMVGQGAPRSGKSTASSFVRETFEGNKRMLVLWGAMERDWTTGARRNEMFTVLLKGRGPGGAYGWERNTYQTLVNYTRAEADKLGTNKVLLAFDEAQNFSLARLFTLKRFVDELIDYRLNPFVLLMAQPEILTMPDRLFKKNHVDLVDRFFLRWHRFRGLRLREFEAVLMHYDRAVWPEEGGVPYTAHFAPTLWTAGFRLAALHPQFVAEFQQLAAELRADDDEFPVKYLVTAVRFLLTELSRSEKRAGSRIAEQVRNAVRNCGFIESTRVIGNAEVRTRTVAAAENGKTIKHSGRAV